MSIQKTSVSTRCQPVVLSVLIAFVGLVGMSHATFIAQDNFSDGDRTTADNNVGNGGGPGLVWYALANSGNATSALTIATDDGSPGIGGGNSLNIRPNSSSGDRPVVGTFAPVTLGPTVGDRIVASMDLRFRADVDAPGGTNLTFRVGLFNSNGTPITTDGQRFDLASGTGNDFGYFARIPIGNPANTGNTSARLSKETGVASGSSSDPLFGSDNSAGTGANVSELGQTSSFPITISDFDPHKIIFGLERTAVGVLVSIQVDNLAPFTAEDTSSPYTTFDEFAMTNMRLTTEWRVDNVVIESISIPEPASAALLVVGLLFIKGNRFTNSRRKLMSTVNRALCVGLILSLSVAPAAWAAEYVVTSASSIASRMATAQPGDTLIMADGVWTNQRIDFTGFGTTGAPITLRPQTPGGVILNGTSQIRISGDHLVVDGLHFKGGTLVNSDHVVQFRGSAGSATNSRFTNSVIESYNPTDLNDKYHWISLYGQNNRVDHNTLIDQQNIGQTLVVWLDEGLEVKHRIDANHFGDRPLGWDNGFETIRIGDSDTSHINAHVVVENNLFERLDGEIEIISGKSNDNIYRYNTFRESAGTLTLRHGHRATVEGNFFLGEGVSTSGAIRVVGEDHRIVNNYIADVGNAADGAISLTAGIPNTIPSGYQQVKNAVIAHNTIVNTSGAAISMDWGLGSGGRSLLPQNVTIASNLISSTAAPLFEGQEGNGFTWTDNIAFGASLGLSPRPGIHVVNPQLVKGPDGLWRPSASSPAIDAAPNAFVTHDFDGQPRIGLFDIGADELSSAQIVRKPLTSNDVGATWFNYTPPTNWGGPPPLPPGAFVVIEAEHFTSISDPDNDGVVWTVVATADASGGAAIKAPTGSVSAPSMHETLAHYDLVFSEGGTYTAYYRARGFSGSSDSFFTPTGFGVDPTVTDNVSSDGNFRWEVGGGFTIGESHIGMPLEFRLGRRESLTEIDAIIFHKNGSLTPFQLDAILQQSAVPEPSCLSLLLGMGICTLRRSRR